MSPTPAPPPGSPRSGASGGASGGARPSASPVSIRGPDIELGAFLKICQACASGGEAKVAIQSGAVAVNGVTETKRRHRLRPGDRVRLRDGRAFLVVAGE